MNFADIKSALARNETVFYKNTECKIKELVLWHDGNEYKYSANLQDINNKNINYRVNINDIMIDKHSNKA